MCVLYIYVARASSRGRAVDDDDARVMGWDICVSRGDTVGGSRARGLEDGVSRARVCVCTTHGSSSSSYIALCIGCRALVVVVVAHEY